MDNIQFIFLVLPAMTSLNWVIFHSVYAFRTDTYRIVLPLLGLTTVLLMIDSLYGTPGASFHTMAWTNLAAQLTAPCLIPLVWLYLDKIRKGPGHHSIWHTIWVFIPVALFTGAVLLYNLAGAQAVETMLKDTYQNGWLQIKAYKGTIAYLYYIWSIIVFRAVIVLEVILMIGYMVYVSIQERLSLHRMFAFLSGKGSVSVLELQIFNIILELLIFPCKLLPTKNFIDSHPWVVTLIGLCLTFLLAAFGMTAVFSVKKDVALEDFVNSFRFNYGKKSKKKALRYAANVWLSEADEESMDYLRARIPAKTPPSEQKADEKPQEVHDERTISERLFAEIAAKWSPDSMQAGFDRLMTYEQLYLQSKLRLDDVAARLHTNKTYLSRMINNTYNIGFSEVINIMRIDFAEQYIIRHQSAKQVEIAEACGFISASAFNNTFKKVTGMTPKAWIAQWNEHNKK